jgi:glycosyltransferase involved in cell wall biosynthesis
MRAINLSNALVERGHEVVLWSSDFDHMVKAHRFGSPQSIKLSEQLSVRLIQSCGYKSNVGLRRLLDHFQLGWNLRKMLKDETAPDVAFIGFPPVEPAWIMLRWLRFRSTPTVLDVKDAWPEMLFHKFPPFLKFFAKVALLPYTAMMRSSFKTTNSLSSITEEFLSWSLQKVNRPQSPLDMVLPLTSADLSFSDTEIKEAEDYWDGLGVTSSDRDRVFFVGTLNEVFDFEAAIDAAQTLDIEVVIAGDGPQRDYLLDKTSELPNFILPGWISSAQALVLSKRSKISFAPIKLRVDFEKSIPNKFIDSFRLGKPIVTSLGGVAGNLLENTNTGVLYAQNPISDLTNKLEKLFSSQSDIVEMSLNARDLYLERFDCKKIYGELVADLENLARG